MKHNLRLLTMLVMIGFYMFLSSKTFAQTATPPSAGDGTEANPYQIETLDNLYWLSQNDAEWDKHYIQTVDIDASETVGWDNDSGFTPIGNVDTQFTGTYSGQGYAIDSLFIDRPGINGVGLFGYISGSSVLISNVMVTNADITGENWVGGIVGRNVDATLEKVGSTGQVSGYFYVGGIVGHSTSGIIKYSFSMANVSADSKEAGGLAGKIKNGNIQNSYAQGDVSSDSKVGGFVGYVYHGTISYCYSTGVVNGTFSTHGFIGYEEFGNYSNCFYDKETSGRNTGNGATGLTSEEMRDTASFENWDFIFNDNDGDEQIWGQMEENNYGYPFLKWQWKGPKPTIQELDTIVGTCSVTVDANPEAITIFGDTIAGVTDSSLSYNMVGEYLITWKYQGAGGKTSVQEQIVKVVDTESPVPDVESLDDITDVCSVTISDIPTATDNCVGTITATIEDELEYTEQGTYTITWTYDDGNGNISTQEQTVIIKDDVAPEITNIGDQEFEIDGESAYYSVSGDELDIKEYSDNCEVSEITNDFNDSNTLDGAEIPEGTTTITWTVKDISGNSSSCSYDVTVKKTATAINDIAADGFSIYPNPVSDKLSVVSDNYQIKTIDIYDLTGKVMYSNANVYETEKIDFSQFNSGVYIITIETDHSIFTRKILKK